MRTVSTRRMNRASKLAPRKKRVLDEEHLYYHACDAECRVHLCEYTTQSMDKNSIRAWRTE